MTEIDVLVVDDEPGVADLVATFLRRADDRFSVAVETDPEDGLAAARRDEYDCVVSDYHMPGMDGLALLERVADEEDDDLARILHSSDRDRSLREAARRADVEYVPKRLEGEQYERMADTIAERVSS